MLLKLGAYSVIVVVAVGRLQCCCCCSWAPPVLLLLQLGAYSVVVVSVGCLHDDFGSATLLLREMAAESNSQVQVHPPRHSTFVPTQTLNAPRRTHNSNHWTQHTHTMPQHPDTRAFTILAIPAEITSWQLGIHSNCRAEL